MEPLFHAASLAVVGVSEAADNLGRNIVANLVNFGYEGDIFAVGPRGGSVFGRPIYPAVAECPGRLELAIILTPARFIPEIIDQCGEKGVRWAVIESGGFRELGDAGGVLEGQLLAAARRHGIRFVGPNCIGVIHTATSLYAPFMALPAPYRKGGVSVLAQSGGVGLSIAERLSTSGVGLNKFVSMGNKLNLDEVDYLQYYMEDPTTRVIYSYLEDFKRGRAFFELARGSSKPILLHKSNTNPLSSVIAASHTAALAGDDGIVNAACEESGAIFRVRSLAEATTALQGFAMPRLQGRNLAVLSRSGGHAVVAADACAAYGFELPPLQRKILDEVQQHVRAGVIRLGNPLDLGDIYDLDLYFALVEHVLQQADIHGILFIHVSQMVSEREVSRQLLRRLGELSLAYRKPVAVMVEIPFEEKVLLQQTSDFPFFKEPLEAVQALAYQYRYPQPRPAEPSLEVSVRPAAWPEDAVKSRLHRCRAEARQPLLHEALDLLECIGVATVAWRMAKTLPQTLQAAQQIGYPVVLKAVAPSLLHKSEQGAVVLHIDSAQRLELEWQRMHSLAADIVGMVVQKMVPGSREVIVGGKRDLSLGPVVLVGLGGILVEVLKDIKIGLAPVSAQTAADMLQGLGGGRLLGRFRGMQPADQQPVIRAMVQVSQLLARFPEIMEIDINPILLDDQGDGGLALDARLRCQWCTDA